MGVERFFVVFFLFSKEGSFFCKTPCPIQIFGGSMNEIVPKKLG